MGGDETITGRKKLTQRERGGGIDELLKFGAYLESNI